tara:strand:+ start:743 stop:880 length:138 start_codon:yes stop_codon:yes gene_type:complete
MRKNVVREWRIKMAEHHIQRAKQTIALARSAIRRERALIKKLGVK